MTPQQQAEAIADMNQHKATHEQKIVEDIESQREIWPEMASNPMSAHRCMGKIGFIKNTVETNTYPLPVLEVMRGYRCSDNAICHKIWGWTGVAVAP